MHEHVNFELVASLEDRNNISRHTGDSIHFQREKKEFHASASTAEEVKTPKISHVSAIC